MLDRLQQRPRDQVVGAEQVGLVDGRALRLGQPDREQLARVVPLVQRLARVDALVALQPQQRRLQHARQRLGGLGLADAGLALEQDRLRQPDREEQRGGEPAVGEVVDRVEPLQQVVDVGDEQARGRVGGHWRARNAPGSAANASAQPGPQKK